MKLKNSNNIMALTLNCILLVTTNAAAMEDEEKSKTILQGHTQYEQLIPTVNFDANPTPKPKKNRCLKWFLGNRIAFLTLGITGVAGYIGYKYYSILDDECHKMEGACNDAVKEVESILTAINQIQTVAGEIQNFINNCPAANEKFIPQLLTYLTECCQEQPEA